MFVGRSVELEVLKNYYRKSESQLICLYGRRRIGKSELLKKFGEQTNFLYFEGIEGGKTPAQIKNIVVQLKEQIHDTNLYRLDLSSWDAIFLYLSEYIKTQKSKKLMIVFDEFQWMAAGQSKLVSLLKSYWDRYLLKQNVLLVLCGSIASFMIKKVVKSNALYGRIDLVQNVQALKIQEAQLFFKYKTPRELINYFCIFGTVPKYLTLIQAEKSFDKNICELFFSKDAYFLTEVEKIFFNHFKESHTYKLIVIALVENGPLTIEEISKKINMSSGGGVKSYIDNLCLAQFIVPITNFAFKEKKSKKYKIIDPYLYFYFRCVYPYLNGIENGQGQSIYNNKVKPLLNTNLGFAFENLCRLHINEILHNLGIQESVIDIGNYSVKGKRNNKGLQVDIALRFHDQSLGIVEIKNANSDKLKMYQKEIELKKDILFKIEKKNIYSYLILSSIERKKITQKNDQTSLNVFAFEALFEKTN